MTLAQQLSYFHAELLLAVAAMALLILGVFSSGNPTRRICWLAIAALAVALLLVVTGPVSGEALWNGGLRHDALAAFAKVLLLVGGAAALVLSLGYIRHEGMERFEYPVLILLATVGMMLMVSANDLIALYLGLELQSLALYVIAAFRRDNARATEAGLKYFVLGSISSCMLLYGASLIYGFAGSTNFTAIAQNYAAGATPSLGLTIGIVFLAAGLAFKVSGVPFHMWTPDVYEGAPTAVTAFFASAPKVAAMVLFLRAILGPFGELDEIWRQIIVVIAALSMALGAVAAIWQKNIKRLMAYSSIGHVGYALVGLAAASQDGVRGVLIYLSIYLVMTVGTFACILSMRQRDGMVESIDDLSGLARSHPGMAFALAAFMFSLAGVPPLAGFFAKFYVFNAAIQSGLYALAVFGVLTSVIGAYYYLRIVKIMYFDDLAVPLATPLRGDLKIVMGLSTAFTTLFFIWPAPLTEAARVAAKALLP